jgi:hypothetical protein
VLELTERAFEIFRAQHGIASVRQLEDAGVSRNARRRLIESGALIIEHRSVVRAASAPLTFEARCVVLCLAHPLGFVTGPTCGKLLGLRRMPSPMPIHFSVPHGLHLTDHDVKLRQSTQVTSRDTYRMSSGIVVASYSRLAFDLSVDLSPMDHASVIEQMIQRDQCSIQGLAATARRLCHPLRPGSRQFANIVVERGHRAASESHPEVVLAHRLRARGVPVEPQFADLHLDDGSRIRLDLAVPSVRWGIEIDVHPDHLLLEGTSKDKRRDRKCHRIDWQIERVTELDLLDLEALLDELEELFRARVSNRVFRG